MKKRISIGLAVIGVVAALVLLLVRKAGSEASYQGIPASQWAAAFYPNFNAHNTNAAVMAFQTMGSEAVPTLRELLRTKETWYARTYLRVGGFLPTGTRRYLVSKIKPGQSGSKRVAAARALGVVGTNATAAVPDLIAALADQDARWAAAQALASIGGPAIPALIQATKTNDVNVRHAAVYGLGQAGTNAAPATAALLDCLRDPNQSIQGSAAYSLSQVGRLGLPVVLEAFTSEDPEQRKAAVKALKAMNTPPRQIMGTLMEFSTNASPRLRESSLEAMQSLLSLHPRVVINYFKATSDADAGVRAAGARALSQANRWSTNAALSEVVGRLLGRNASLQSNAVETLTVLLSDPDPMVREAAQQSLATLQVYDGN